MDKNKANAINDAEKKIPYSDNIYDPDSHKFDLQRIP